MLQDQKEVIRYILSQGCKVISNLVIQKDKAGDTPLHLISKSKCYVEELVNLRTVDWMVVNLDGLNSFDMLNAVLDTCNAADQVSCLT